MNTPSSKPTRYPHTIHARHRKYLEKNTRTPVLEGHSVQAVTGDDILILIGRIVTTWTSVEELMIMFMNKLIVGQPGDSPARQIFRSVMAERVRISIMEALLLYAPHNASLDREHDEILASFDKLNRMRNGYVHGRWWTHDSGALRIQESAEDGFSMLRERAVPREEIEGVLVEMYQLHRRLQFLCYPVLKQAYLEDEAEKARLAKQPLKRRSRKAGVKGPAVA
jgi:hypothetical protein